MPRRGQDREKTEPQINSKCPGAGGAEGKGEAQNQIDGERPGVEGKMRRGIRAS